jgi:hypothetical protein
MVWFVSAKNVSKVCENVVLGCETALSRHQGSKTVGRGHRTPPEPSNYGRFVPFAVCFSLSSIRDVCTLALLFNRQEFLGACIVGWQKVAGR